MPTSTCRRTTSATAAVMTASSRALSRDSSRSRANSTSVTAWLRGRLPTCVVRIRSMLPVMPLDLRPGSSAVRVVGGVIAREPALERLMGIRAPVARDPGDVGVIEGEFEDQPVRVGHINRAAVAVFEHIGVRGLDTRLRNARLDGRLSLCGHPERNVVKGRRRHLRAKLRLVGRVGELKEGERPAVTDPVEGVHVGAHLAEQFVRFAPSGHQRQPNDVLVEAPRLLLVLGDVGGVVQARGQFGHDSYLLLKLVPELHPVAARLSLPQEAAGGELGVVDLVGQIPRPGCERPAGSLNAEARVDQIHRVARGHVVRIPPGTADLLVVDAAYGREAVAERLTVLHTRIDGGARDQRGLVANDGRIFHAGDLTVGVTKARVQAEAVGRMRIELDLATLVARIEVTEVLRRVRRQKHEEVAVGGLRVIEADAKVQAAIEEVALEANFPGVREFSVEQVVHAPDPGGLSHSTDPRLIEAAAAEAAAPAAVEGEILRRLVAQGAFGLHRVPGVLAYLAREG